MTIYIFPYRLLMTIIEGSLVLGTFQGFIVCRLFRDSHPVPLVSVLLGFDSVNFIGYLVTVYPSTSG